jgi:cytidylate kinase
VTIITISRQMGSQGDELAAELARRLGWRCLCREVINQAAVDAGVPLVALADIDELGFLGLRPRREEWQAYQAQVERIIHRLAEEENAIIVGRGSQVALRNHRHALHLRVVAPLETRLSRFQQQEQISPEAAQARLEASDKARNRYLQRSYGVALDDPTLYHLVINTGLVELSQAVALVLQAVRQLQYEPD